MQIYPLKGMTQNQSNKQLEDYIAEVDYGYLNNQYVPTEELKKPYKFLMTGATNLQGDDKVIIGDE